MSFWTNVTAWWDGLFELESPPRKPAPKKAPEPGLPVAEVRAVQGARPWRKGRNAQGHGTDEVKRVLLDELMRLEMAQAGLVERRFLRRLQATVALRDLGLPPFPVTVLELKRMLARGSEVPAARLARVVEGDASLVRAVLQQARGAEWAKGPDSLKSAIVRIGNDALWRIAMRVAVEETVFRVPRYQQQVEDVRVHCFAVAETAAWMLGDGSERGTAWLAGLLHDLGKLVIYREASEVRGEVEPELLEAVQELAHAPVGLLMARAWGLGEMEAEAIGFHHAVSGAVEGNQRLGVYLHCADMAAHIARAQQAREVDTGREDLVSAARGLGFEAEDAIHVADQTLLRFRRLRAA